MSTISWVGGTHGLWSTASHWSGDQVPVAGDDVFIGAGDAITIGVAAAAADITLGAGSSLIVESTLDVSGTLAGGTVRLAGGTVDLANNATLDGVSWVGTLAVTDGETLNVAGGLHVAGPGGTVGTIELQGAYHATSVLVDDSEVWNHETVVGNAEINENGAVSSDTLTLGRDETVISPATTGFVNFVGYNGSTNSHTTTENLGLIIDDDNVGFAFGTFDNSGTIQIGPGALANPFEETFRSTGLIEAVGGGTGTFSTYYGGNPDGSDITNFSAATGALNGGTWEAGTGSTLDLQLSGVIARENALVVLNGPAAAIQSWNAGTSAWQSIADTVTSIGGTVELLAAANWESAGKLTVGGTVTLDGGTLSATGGLAIDGTALISGFGTVLAGSHPVFLNAALRAAGGLLDIGAPLVGSGALEIAAGASLELGSGASATATFGGIATLLLDHPKLFTGALAGVVAGDVLVLGSTDASGVMLSGGTLTVGITGGHPEHFAVTGSATGASFIHSGVNTVVTFAG
jgi:hypothetical protein